MNAKVIAGWILGGGLGITILGLALKMVIALEVAGQLAAAGIIPEADFAIAQGDILENAEDIVRVESKAERFAQILMED